jgi:hypothetical protein
MNYRFEVSQTVPFLAMLHLREGKTLESEEGKLLGSGLLCKHTSLTGL